MNAIQPNQPPSQPLEPRRSPRTRRPVRNSFGAVAGETTAKFVVNVVISTAALSGFVQLLPYHLSQQTKLREVRSEVKRAEQRVKNLRTDFKRSFDPGQAKSVMQEQSTWIDPTQRQVVWQDSGTKDDN